MSEVCKKSPSELINENDELTAFCLNAAVMNKFIIWQNRRDLLRLEATKNTMRQAIVEALGGEVAPPITFDDDEPEETDGY